MRREAQTKNGTWCAIFDGDGAAVQAQEIAGMEMSGLSYADIDTLPGSSGSGVSAVGAA